MKVYGMCLEISRKRKPQLSPVSYNQYRVIVLAKSKAAVRRALTAAGLHFFSTLEMVPTANDQELKTATVEGRIYARGWNAWNDPFVDIT